MRRVLRGVAVALAAAVGAVALGLAAGFGPARLGHGATPAAVAATAATLVLAAGLVWLALRVTRRPATRIAAFTAGLVVVAMLAFPAEIAAWAAFPPHAERAAGPPAGATPVTIDAGDGVTLAGWYLPTDDGAAVVLSHGAGSTSDDVRAQAQVLHEAGYGVLAVDARGHGESSGPAMDLGWWGEADIVAALDAVETMDGVDPHRLGLVGMSMGGEESIGTAGVDGRVRVVVAEGASQRTAADKAGWLPGHPLGWLQRAMDAERDVLVTVMTTAPRPDTLRAAAGATDAPILLVAAGTLPDEVAAAAWIAEDNPHVEVWEVPGAGHIGGLATAPDEWRERVIGFVDAALAP